MAPSIRYRDVVDFGKKLAAELTDGERSDATERWMIFHLAELIDRAKTAPPNQKVAAERECVDLISKLWSHRTEFRGPHRPMKDFEKVFTYLERIGQDRPVYYEMPDVGLSKEATEWLQLAEGLDYAARVLIRWCVSNATLEAAKKDARWALEPVARVLGDGADTASARVILYDATVFHGAGKKLDEEALRVQQLAKIRERLDAVLDLASSMKEEIDSRLGTGSKRTKATKKKKTGRRSRG